MPAGQGCCSGCLWSCVSITAFSGAAGPFSPAVALAWFLRPAEQMNVAFAMHEIISDHLTASLAWLESGGGADIGQLERRLKVRPFESGQNAWGKASGVGAYEATWPLSHERRQMRSKQPPPAFCAALQATRKPAKLVAARDPAPELQDDEALKQATEQVRRVDGGAQPQPN